MKVNIAALTAGIIFSLGLCISRMVDPSVVIGFLDVTGQLDPTLLFVMAGALVISVISFRFILKRSKPLCCDRFSVPAGQGIDRRLVTGAALFGIGWGLAGICPGPAVAALAFGLKKSFVFALSMLLGMAIFQIYQESSNKNQ